MRGVYEKVKGSGDWYISYFDADGRRHREHVGRRSVAIEAYVSKKREIREAKFIPPTERRSTVTFEDLFQKRMEDLKRTLSPQTYKHLKSSFRHPRIEELKSKRAQRILPSDIEAVLRGMHSDGLAGATIRNYRAMVCAVFNYGMKHDYVAANPVRKTIAPKRAKHRVRFLSAEEEESIRVVIRDRFQEREPELDLLLHTGMRSGEAYGLTWDRVHLDRAIIEIPETGKTGMRYVPINSACRSAIEQLHRQSKGSEFVIPRAGEHNKALPRWFGTAVKVSGVIHATPHTLRHTFASRLVMAGVNLLRVQELLGHKNIEMTMKYAHLDPELGRADIEKLCAPPPRPMPPKRVAAISPSEAKEAKTA